MSESLQKISREGFYERIWNTPIVKLGKEFGYSYLEMVQLCQKLNVPRPDGGYWFRLRNGGAAERIGLPPANPDTPLEIFYGPRLNENSESTATENSPPDPPVKANPVLPSVQKAIVPASSNKPVAPQCKSPDSAPVAQSPSRARVTGSNADKGEPAIGDPTVIRFTRSELYEAVWSKSCQKLAAELGISDVALAKICKRMGIPRPSLGYWARVAVREKVSKISLPAPQTGQDRIVTFDVSANKKRREEWRSNNSDVDALAVDLTLPAEGADLHPIAQRHLRALEKKKPDENGFIILSGRDVFRCDLTPSLVNRLCGALHAILLELDWLATIKIFQ